MDIHPYKARPAAKDGRERSDCAICGNVALHAMHTGECGQYVDAGWSGAKARRPELDRLMADARARKVDIVLCWKLDRWGRSVSNSMATIQEL
ncbi:MAG: recombinase family protein [Candidatus Solibacter sp.]